MTDTLGTGTNLSGSGIKPQLTKSSLAVLERRYLRKDTSGKPIETPEGMFARVAHHLAQPEAKYGGDSAAVARAFYEMMASLNFLPNTPTLVNAGIDESSQQLAACFVLPVGDSMEEIFDSIKHAALIHKTGGGTGFAFSRLRPTNDLVMSTKGVASGPVSFMEVFNAATEAIKQGGVRRGANMGILRVDHPNILDFITCKNDNNKINNFNISVAVTEKFMQAVERGEDYDLINPRNGQVTGKLNAREVFNNMVESAWKNGEPGMVFIDRINRDNPTPQIGEMESTNPCGEQPLLPYEACNLGSINLGKMLRTGKNGKKEIDWDLLRKTTRLATRFLDNVVEMNVYPLPQIEAVTRNGNRKIGLGIMGWADMLIMLGVPYNSDEAVDLAEDIMSFIRYEARVESRKMGEERDSFPNYHGSLFDDPTPNPDYAGEFAHQAMRNATVTTIAPTGTISVIAGASGGIEPLFAISFQRNVMDNTVLPETHPLFVQIAKERGFYSDDLMRKIARVGTLEGMAEVPEDVRRVWVVAHDITPEWHVKMQAAWQRHCDNAVSKTCNFNHNASVDYVRDVYMLAYKLGLKGVTVYRDGSRDNQVLNIGTVTDKSGKVIASVEAPKAVTPAPAPAVSVSSAVKAPIKNSGIKTNGAAHARERGSVMTGRTHKLKVADKTVFVTVNKDEVGIAEVFVNVGKSGSETDSLTEGLGRVISVSLRAGVAPQEIIDQLSGIRTAGTIVGQPTSIPDAVARALAAELGTEGQQALAQAMNKASGGTLEDCPQGHQGCAVEFLEGCATCRTCGNSKCS